MGRNFRAIERDPIAKSEKGILLSALIFRLCVVSKALS